MFPASFWIAASKNKGRSERRKGVQLGTKKVHQIKRPLSVFAGLARLFLTTANLWRCRGESKHAELWQSFDCYHRNTMWHTPCVSHSLPHPSVSHFVSLIQREMLIRSGSEQHHTHTHTLSRTRFAHPLPLLNAPTFGHVFSLMVEGMERWTKVR